MIGHEITHGFDDQGSQKDGEGNLVDWWEPETKTRYLEKARWEILKEEVQSYSVADSIFLLLREIKFCLSPDA